jgi:folate-binding protein YgfZ
MRQTNYNLLKVRGSDAAEFLQGQLTQDIHQVTRESPLPAAWCNPKGRVIVVLRVLWIDDGFGLVLPADLAEPVCKRLAMYRLRADVGLDIAGSDWTHTVFHTEADMTALDSLGLRPAKRLNASLTRAGLTAVNVGIDEPCVELFGDEADFQNTGIDPKRHRDLPYLAGAKIRAGIPDILGNTSEKYTPHMLNLDLLGAISFDKGCYVGQEVVAKTQNLGKSKRRTMRYSSDRELSVGDKLSVADTSAGEIISVCGRDLLAVTPVDLQDRILSAGNASLTPMPLPY